MRGEAVGDPVDVLLDRHAMLDSTEGLPGPVMVKKLGKPTVVSPR
jgi:hypothetical protein